MIGAQSSNIIKVFNNVGDPMQTLNYISATNGFMSLGQSSGNY